MRLTHSSSQIQLTVAGWWCRAYITFSESRLCAHLLTFPMCAALGSKHSNSYKNFAPFLATMAASDFHRFQKKSTVSLRSFVHTCIHRIRPEALIQGSDSWVKAEGSYFSATRNRIAPSDDIFLATCCHYSRYTLVWRSMDLPRCARPHGLV